mmetsp:Transcript_7685/g.9615  ORF Transcript_7685/g.9615 Transcript_7685/m.9615 type:complete len:273 (+) Transcript_7685:666-1484(+)
MIPRGTFPIHDVLFHLLIDAFRGRLFELGFQVLHRLQLFLIVGQCGGVQVRELVSEPFLVGSGSLPRPDPFLQRFHLTALPLLEERKRGFEQFRVQMPAEIRHAWITRFVGVGGDRRGGNSGRARSIAVFPAGEKFGSFGGHFCRCVFALPFFGGVGFGVVGVGVGFAVLFVGGEAFFGDFEGSGLGGGGRRVGGCASPGATNGHALLQRHALPFHLHLIRVVATIRVVLFLRTIVPIVVHIAVNVAILIIVVIVIVAQEYVACNSTSIAPP